MRKIGNLVSVLLTALLISFIAVPNVAEGVDEIFLMENRNRQYFNFLNPKKAEHLYIPHDFDGKNLIGSTLEPGFYEGFDVKVNDDGSVTINGVNNEGDVHIRYGRVELDDGQYLLSDGGASEQIEKGFSYVYDGETFAQLPQRSGFTADSQSHSSYEVGIVIFKGCMVENLTFYPMLVAGEEDTEYHRYVSTYQYGEDSHHAVLLHLNKNDYESISEKDLKVFRNAARYQYVSDWTSLIFEDGTGIQIKDGQET